MCTKPSITGGSFTPDQVTYKEGVEIEFKCDKDLVASGNDKSTCTNGAFAVDFKCQKRK